MRKLSDDEKQEILRCLAADLPLPERYRFVLFEEKREAELVWDGKSDDVCDLVHPFDILERWGASNNKEAPSWSNRLIWGENKLILSSLLHGSMREEIERQGGFKLIYLDPPFDVGADFLMEIEIGEERENAKENLEGIAYRDTWGKGSDSFLTMMYERLRLVYALLAEEGSFFLHCDWRLSGQLRLCLDEIFGRDCFLNEIIWHYTGGGRAKRYFSRKHDSLFWYCKSKRYLFNLDAVRIPYKETSHYGKSGIVSASGKKYMPHPEGTPVDDVWSIPMINPLAEERIGYPTQKPEALLERIIKATTHEGDLVADFFCGSGTTAAVAQRLGRKWLCTDLGKQAIHTTRKRLLGLQRQLQREGKAEQTFEVLQLVERGGGDTVERIVEAYGAERVEGYKRLQGTRAGHGVAVGSLAHPITRSEIREVLLECEQRGIEKADILGFSYALDTLPAMLEEARERGIALFPKRIPSEIFEKRAVEKKQAIFQEMAYIEAIPHLTPASEGRAATLAIELARFVVCSSQGALQRAEGELAKKSGGGSQLIVEGGQLLKVTVDKKGVVKHEALTQSWRDWVDLWAVDFAYEGEEEALQRKAADTGDKAPELRESGEQRGGGGVFKGGVFEGGVFKGGWASFRTKKKRSLEWVSAGYPLLAGHHKIAVKVIDIFGNEAMTVLSVEIK